MREEHSINMSDRVLGVRADEVRSLTRGRSFVGLPKEEIERHFATLEVAEMTAERADCEIAWRPLVACVVAHHNYRWLTHVACDAGRRSLYLTSPIRPEDGTLFLDEAWCSSAARLLARELITSDAAVVRLAGLLDVPKPSGDGPLHVLFVTMLRSADVVSRGRRVHHLELKGPGELSTLRDELDPCGRTIVHNLHAL